MKEEVVYKPLPGFEQYYSIGNDGSVIRHKGNLKIKTHNSYRINHKGITATNATIHIMVNNKRYTISLANVVAQLFVPNPNPTILKYIDYKDGNRDNCHYTNLVWVKHKVFVKKEKTGFGIKLRITKDSKLQWT